MDEAAGHDTSKGVSARRRVAAVMLPPLVLAALTVPASWNELVHLDAASSGGEALYGAVVGTLALPYFLGTPAAALTLALAWKLKAPNRAWVMGSLYLAVCLPVLLVIEWLNGGVSDLVAPTLVYGAPMAVVFCLLLRTR